MRPEPDDGLETLGAVTAIIIAVVGLVLLVWLTGCTMNLSLCGDIEDDREIKPGVIQSCPVNEKSSQKAAV